MGTDDRVLEEISDRMSLGPESTLAHYRITGELGAGGMGVVYRATDSKLGREVALKVLPEEMAASPERLDRFRREAMMLASLDHPGVVGVYSVEESEGRHFLTMQLVEGESLDRLIPENGMAVDRILEVASTVAEALAEQRVAQALANVAQPSARSLRPIALGLEEPQRRHRQRQNVVQSQVLTIHHPRDGTRA